MEHRAGAGPRFQTVGGDFSSTLFLPNPGPLLSFRGIFKEQQRGFTGQCYFMLPCKKSEIKKPVVK